jgi:hypothetical protein
MNDWRNESAQLPLACIRIIGSRIFAILVAWRTASRWQDRLIVINVMMQLQRIVMILLLSFLFESHLSAIFPVILQYSALIPLVSLLLVEDKHKKQTDPIPIAIVDELDKHYQHTFHSTPIGIVDSHVDNVSFPSGNHCTQTISLADVASSPPIALADVLALQSQMSPSMHARCDDVMPIAQHTQIVPESSPVKAYRVRETGIGIFPMATVSAMCPGNLSNKYTVGEIKDADDIGSRNEKEHECNQPDVSYPYAETAQTTLPVPTSVKQLPSDVFNAELVSAVSLSVVSDVNLHEATNDAQQPQPCAHSEPNIPFSTASLPQLETSLSVSPVRLSTPKEVPSQSCDLPCPMDLTDDACMEADAQSKQDSQSHVVPESPDYSMTTTSTSITRKLPRKIELLAEKRQRKEGKIRMLEQEQENSLHLVNGKRPRDVNVADDVIEQEEYNSDSSISIISGSTTSVSSAPLKLNQRAKRARHSTMVIEEDSSQSVRVATSEEEDEFLLILLKQTSSKINPELVQTWKTYSVKKFKTFNLE